MASCASSRCHYGQHLYRILYRRSGKLLVLLHMFEKRSAKLPPREIAIAKEPWEDFRARMGADPACRPGQLGTTRPRLHLPDLPISVN